MEAEHTSGHWGVSKSTCLVQDKILSRILSYTLSAGTCLGSSVCSLEALLYLDLKHSTLFGCDTDSLKSHQTHSR
jgi:hypothetical protein